MTDPDHPAPYTPEILDAIRERLAALPDTDGIWLDPFAGIGRVHQLPVRAVGSELEPEWARQGPGPTVVANVRRLPFRTASMAGCIVSPCYGNRFADSHVNTDRCKTCRGARTVAGRRCPVCRGTGLSRRRSYTHDLGRRPTRGSAAVLQWGDSYRNFHEKAWAEVARTLRPPSDRHPAGAHFILNCSDHYRDGELQRVTDWHVLVLNRLGFRPVKWVRVPTPRQRHGENGDLRAEYESVVVFADDRPADLLSARDARSSLPVPANAYL